MLEDAIGVFDSGVGGLSIWREITRLLPQENTIYVADQKYLPYGEKSDSLVLERATKITQFLLNQGCSLIVVACNSATVCALTGLRHQFSVPFVGVEPAIKPAAAKSKTGKICVLATSKTARSNRQTNLIKKHAKKVSVRILVAPEFVNLVEEFSPSSHQTAEAVRRYFLKNSLSESDVLILGCTHYIFLKEVIQMYLSPGMIIIEPSKAVAERVKSLFKKQSKPRHKKVGKHQFLTTGNAESFSIIAEKLLRRPVSASQIKI